MSVPVTDSELADIEVTPEMIEAGAAVLCGFEILTAGEEYWAEEVYRAMEMARRRHGKAQ